MKRPPSGSFTKPDSSSSRRLAQGSKPGDSKSSKSKKTTKVRPRGSWKSGANREYREEQQRIGRRRKILFGLCPLLIVTLVIWLPKLTKGDGLGDMPTPVGSIEFSGRISPGDAGFFLAQEPHGCYLFTRESERIWLVAPKEELVQIRRDLHSSESDLYVAGPGSLYESDDPRLIPGHREARWIIVSDPARFRRTSAEEYERRPSGIE